MTDHPPHDHSRHGHAPASMRPAAPEPAEPASWLLHSGTQRLLAALGVIAALLAALAWATSAQV